jgi:hypothetical protein
VSNEEELARLGLALPLSYEKVMKALPDLLAENARLRASNEDLVGVLRAVEWADAGMIWRRCPRCLSEEPSHARGCDLAAALANAEEKTP